MFLEDELESWALSTINVILDWKEKENPDSFSVVNLNSCYKCFAEESIDFEYSSVKSS